MTGCENKTKIRVASFNVSMESTNYGSADVKALKTVLEGDGNQQVKNIAETIQRVRPDIILLNEFDYSEDFGSLVKSFQSNYLGVSQNGQDEIHYPYSYSAPVNTGVVFPVDLNGDGEASLPADAYGWGHYPGHYGMLLLSKFPIDVQHVRSFQKFLWKDMPGAKLPLAEDGTSYYSEEQLNYFRLSSKSHWDVPIDVAGKTLHVLASHPTPPVFDGPEDRNGRRNFDEIRLWADYIGGASYLYNDQRKPGLFDTDSSFVILGDLNASDNGGDSFKGAIQQLLDHPLVKDTKPTSDGAKELWLSEDKHRATHHRGWRLDYALPSSDLNVSASGVYWPSANSSEAHLVAERKLSSDHRLVWVDVEF